jgi:hypothetical protein
VGEVFACEAIVGGVDGAGEVGCDRVVQLAWKGVHDGNCAGKMMSRL